MPPDQAIQPPHTSLAAAIEQGGSYRLGANLDYGLDEVECDVNEPLVSSLKPSWQRPPSMKDVEPWHPIEEAMAESVIDPLGPREEVVHEVGLAFGRCVD